MSGPFDFVNAINQHKDLLTGTTADELLMKDYNAFIINRAFSIHRDTLFMANAMNEYGHNVDPYLQYRFYLNIVRPRKRFGWIKSTKSDTVELLSTYFGCNTRRALEYASILSDNDIAAIQQELEQGGVQ